MRNEIHNLNPELEIAKSKKKPIEANPIFEELKRVETLRNQVMGISKDMTLKKEINITKIDESVITKALNLSHEKLLKTRNKKIESENEFLK